MEQLFNSKKDIQMNPDAVDGNWQQFKGAVHEQLGKLSADHLDAIAGERDRLVGKIQKFYGITRDQAEVHVKRYERHNKEQRAIAATGVGADRRAHQTR